MTSFVLFLCSTTLLAILIAIFLVLMAVELVTGCIDFLHEEKDASKVLLLPANQELIEPHEEAHSGFTICQDDSGQQLYWERAQFSDEHTVRLQYEEQITVIE